MSVVGFSHGPASWPSFTAFHAFRRRLAREIGIELDRMQGFGGEQSWDRSGDALTAFLAMSDTEGVFDARELEPITRRLTEILGTWPIDDADRTRALQLVGGMQEAIQRGERFRIVPQGRKRS